MRFQVEARNSKQMVNYTFSSCFTRFFDMLIRESDTIIRSLVVYILYFPRVL